MAQGHPESKQSWFQMLIDTFEYHVLNQLKAPLSILVIGEVGSGKSTLVQNLIGEDVATVGQTITSKTTNITLHECEIREINVRVFYTPGVGDLSNSKDLQTLEKLRCNFQTGQFSLIILCFHMTKTSRDSLDIIKHCQNAGIPWDKTFIALTFADMAHQDLPDEDLHTAFTRKLLQWQEDITKTMTDEVKNERVVKDLKARILPTTHSRSQKLPNGEDWLTPVWNSILDCTNPEEKRLLETLVRGQVPSRNPATDAFEYILRQLKAPLSILIIGETGSGKSTLVNNLVGENVAKIGKTTKPGTSNIFLHEFKVRGVNIRVFDTPGLGDARGIDLQTLQKLKSDFKSRQFSLIIFCFKLTETRMKAEHVDHFKKYTEIGIPWDNTLVALTFADMAHQTKPTMEKVPAYEEKLQEWRNKITTTLSKKVGVDKNIAEELENRILPTTYRHSELLPNGEEWYTPMWMSILEHLNPEAISLFLKLHHYSIRAPGQTKPTTSKDQFQAQILDLTSPYLWERFRAVLEKIFGNEQSWESIKRFFSEHLRPQRH